MTGARFVAWVGFVFGSLVSIGGNLLAARIPPKPTPPGWAPDVWAQVGSTVWPVALLISVEVLSRTIWPKTLLSRAVRFAGVGAVALFSAVISYQHIQAVLISWNYEGLSAGVGPLAVDGLMVVSGAAMVLGSTAVTAQLDELRDRRPGLVIPEEHKPTDTGLVPPPNVLAEMADQAAEKLGRAKHEQAAEWEQNILGLGKPISVPLPQPRAEAPVNGRRPVSAAAKTRTSRAAAGPTVDEIVPQVVERMASGEPVSKKVIAQEYGVGSTKANEALRRAREQHEARKEEQE